MENSAHTRELHISENNNYTIYLLIALSTIACPLLEAICINKLSSNEDPNSTFTIILLITVLVHLTSAILVAKSASKNSHYVDYVTLEKKHETLINKYQESKEIGNQLFSCNLSLYMSAAALDDFIGDKINHSHDQNYIHQILFPYHQYRNDIFGLSSSSLFNIALYRYSHKDDLLKVYYRRCDDRIPTRDREWHPGHGHVGLAFIRKKAILSTDAQKSDELDIETSSGDSQHYRSFFSIPILATSDNAETPYSNRKPLGVLVITSSEKNEFSRELHEPTLLALSKLIAIYFEMQALSIALFTKEGEKNEEIQTHEEA